jgi:Fur family iron response transcriptional regulator
MPKRIAVQMQRGEIAEMLRNHGIAPTHQRIEIAGVLFSRCEHLSADRLMTIVNARYSEVSKATIYNTLRLFLEKSLIREVIVDPTRVFYDPNIAPHHHFYNMASGELTDIDADNLQLAVMPDLPAGMMADSIDVIVRIRPNDTTAALA